MNTKVKTWLALAEDDLEFAEEVLANKKRPHYAAHLCHQAIEKLLKAITQLRTNSSPARTHNFVNLCDQASLDIPQEKMEWLLGLSPHYLGTRYPEDLGKLQKKYTQVFSENLFRETQEVFQWLKETYLK